MEQSNAMNCFDVLPDEIVENIMSFVRGRDLLKMTEVCKRFNEVFLASEKLLRKIRFDMTTEKSSRNFTEIPERIQSRNYKAIKIRDFQMSEDVCVGEGSFNTFVSFSTLELHESLSMIKLKVLKMINCTVTYKSIAQLLKVVLPSLRELSLFDLVITDIPPEPTVSVIDADSNLEALAIANSIHILLPFFRKLTKLKTFFVYVTRSVTEFDLAKDLIESFLSQQTKLQNLSIYFGRFLTAEFDLTNISWNFQLKCLCLSINFNWVGLNEFLLKHKSLESIGLYNASGFPDFPNLLKTICQMSHLKRIRFNDDTTFAGLEDLKNDSVQHIQFFFNVKVHGRMLSMFPNLKSIEIGNEHSNDETRGFIQLVDIPHQLLKLIKVKEHMPIQFLYRADDVPSDPIAFERDVMNFLEKHSEVIHGVEIGTPAWNSAADFSLSMDFCKYFVSLPNLYNVLLYKASDKERLNTFYSVNVSQERLERFQLK